MNPPDRDQSPKQEGTVTVEFTREEAERLSRGGRPDEATKLKLRASLSGEGEQGEEDGAALIAAERRRQVEAEGWTREHDDQHEEGELARAAACYLDHYVRNLTKAGALLAAEIDRLKRKDATHER